MNAKDVEKRAKDLFESGFYCAESVLQAVAEHVEISSPLIPKIATGFCGGISRSKGMCGAVTGGVMALSMIFGRTSVDAATEEAYIKVRKFLATFENQYGSLNCFDLVGCDFNIEIDRQRWKTSGLETKCSELTGAAARLVTEIADRGLSDRGKT